MHVVIFGDILFKNFSGDNIASSGFITGIEALCKFLNVTALVLCCHLLKVYEHTSKIEHSK